MGAQTETSGDDFAATLAQFTDEFGFRLELITPADDPRMAVVERDGVRVTIRAEADDAAPEPSDREMQVPALRAELVVSRIDGDVPWVTGRAGMRYRDLIPSRLGGRFIASHIEVCDGGPVPDLVHHHAIRFQLIFCQRGWVDVVYEDQGPAFRMQAGDAVLQPPHIRHRVLASSAGARVVEIGCPAEHDTLFDHDMELPNEIVAHDRVFGGQRFVRHVGDAVAWEPSEHEGFAAQVTDIASATNGLGDVRVLRPDGRTSLVATAAVDGEFDFVFVLAGQAQLTIDRRTWTAVEGDSVALPPGQAWSLDESTDDLRLLQIRL